MINRLLRRMTIQSRVVSLFVWLLVILAGFFTWMIRDQINLANRLTQVTERNAQVERSLLLASTRVLSAKINLMRYTMNGAPTPGEALGNMDQARELLAQASSATHGSEQATAIEAAIVEIEEYKILIGKVQMARSGGLDNDVSALLADVAQKELDLEQHIESIVAENAQRMEDENAAELTRLQRRLAMIVLGCVAALGVTLAAVILIERSISRPIHDLRNGTESLRSGQIGRAHV